MSTCAILNSADLSFPTTPEDTTISDEGDESGDSVLYDWLQAQGDRTSIFFSTSLPAPPTQLNTPPTSSKLESQAVFPRIEITSASEISPKASFPQLLSPPPTDSPIFASRFSALHHNTFSPHVDVSIDRVHQNLQFALEADRREECGENKQGARMGGIIDYEEGEQDDISDDVRSVSVSDEEDSIDEEGKVHPGATVHRLFKQVLDEMRIFSAPSSPMKEDKNRTKQETLIDPILPNPRPAFPPHIPLSAPSRPPSSLDTNTVSGASLKPKAEQVALRLLEQAVEEEKQTKMIMVFAERLKGVAKLRRALAAAMATV